MKKNTEVTHVLSFKAALNVKDDEAGREILRKLIEMGFTFEDDKAYVSRQERTYPAADTTIDTHVLSIEPVLWSFNFVEGGFNSVIAITYLEAITKAKLTFPTHEVDPRSFQSHVTKEAQNAYYNYTTVLAEFAGRAKDSHHSMYPIVVLSQE